MAVFVAVYAFVFGLMQGAFVAANVSLLMVSDVVVLLGIVVAGTVIYLVPRKLDAFQSVDMLHRVSLILFVLGSVMIGSCRSNGVLLIVSQIAVLAGFNLFDFGVLMYEIESNRDRANEEHRVIGHTRPIVYLCMTAGLLLGHILVFAVGGYDLGSVLDFVCGASVVVLVATTLMPFYFFDANEEISCEGCPQKAMPMFTILPSSIPLVQESVPEDWESPWRRACNEIARQYQLSPRETEIFFLVAKGRNADYIQQELVISTHTAKTHIANIYRKLDVHSSQELLDLVEEVRTRWSSPSS